MSATPEQLRLVAEALLGDSYSPYDLSNAQRDAFFALEYSTRYKAVVTALNGADRYLRSAVALSLELDALRAERSQSVGGHGAYDCDCVDCDLEVAEIVL